MQVNIKKELLIVELLMKNDKVSVYVKAGSSWHDPTLYLSEKEGSFKAFTTDSGEYENELGEFMLDTKSLNEAELSLANEVVNEISETDSIKPLKSLGWTKFTLKVKYSLKLLEIEKRKFLESLN